MSPPFSSPGVAAAFGRFPAPARAGLLELRGLIFDVARATPEAGPISEALRWGQPAYLTEETGAGSTLRLGVPKAGGFALFAHCQTDIIARFRDQFEDEFAYEGNRAVLFQSREAIKPVLIAGLIKHALTYHFLARGRV